MRYLIPTEGNSSEHFKMNTTIRFRTLRPTRLACFLAATLFVGIGHAQDGSEPATTVIKVSQSKMEAAVIEAIAEKKAEFHGIVACQSRCGSDADDAGEVAYDKNDEPYTYQIPSAKPGGLVAVITSEESPIYLHNLHMHLTAPQL